MEFAPGNVASRDHQQIDVSYYSHHYEIVVHHAHVLTSAFCSCCHAGGFLQMTDSVIRQQLEEVPVHDVVDRGVRSELEEVGTYLLSDYLVGLGHVAWGGILGCSHYFPALGNH
jgi:hypothetical protein